MNAPRHTLRIAVMVLALPFSAAAHPPTAVPPPADVPAAVPEIVAQDMGAFRSMLRRMRIYLLHAGRGTQHFGSLGGGEQIWFVLPSCRPVDPENERRDPCPIDRLEVSALDGGEVRAGRMTTVLDGAVPRRVQAFAVADGVRLIRIRMVTPSGSTRFDGVIRVSEFSEIPVPVGAPTADGYALDFRMYPGR